MVIRIVRRAIQLGKLTPLIRKQLAALQQYRAFTDVETAAIDRLQGLIRDGCIIVE